MNPPSKTTSNRHPSAFLKSIDYSGLVEIEFKYDARDGKYKILDVNPRVWTWNAIGERAGVDFAYVQWQLAMGESVAPSRGRAGAAWMYLSKDIAAGCLEMLAGIHHACRVSEVVSPRDGFCSICE